MRQPWILLGLATTLSCGESSEGTDAGRPETAADLLAPALRKPMNGAMTGSSFTERARKPEFVWDVVPNAVSYELQVDDSCQVSDFHACDFPSPEQVGVTSNARMTFPEPLAVATTAPVGTRYFWRVRACDGSCGAWSRVRYVDVGRQQSDFDGDGYADVAIAAMHTVFFGPPPFTREGELRDETVSADAFTRFGYKTVPIGDADGDGFTDLAISGTGPEDGTAIDRVFVYFGGPDFGSANGDRVLVESDEIGDGFGEDIVAGDFDGNGRADVAVSRDWSEGGPLSVLSVDSERAVSVVEYYGSEQRAPVVRSAGDLNGDGHDDILVFQFDDRIGETYGIILGSSDIAALDLSALTAFGSDALFQLVGDTNRDGFADRAAFRGVSDSSIFLDYGDVELAAPGEHWQSEFGEVLSYAYFATVVGARDFNGDGFDDTAAGVAREGAISEVQLFYGGRGDHSGPDLVLEVAGQYLEHSEGAAMAPGDVDGDGSDDLLLYRDTQWTLFLGGTAPDTVADGKLQY